MITERRTDRETMIHEAEVELQAVKRKIANGFYEAQNYSKDEIQDILELAEKSVQLMKKEIEFEEYWQAYQKVYNRKEVI